MTMLKMSTVHDCPALQYAPDGCNTWTLPKDQREKILNKVLISSNYILDYNGPKKVSSDMVLLYAKSIFSYGLFYLEFRDGIKEGDGGRVKRCYRYTLPMFVSSGRRNYAIDTLNMLLQHDYVLSERQAKELIWSRFVNMHGRIGKNIPNDLHCEHLNRLVKTAIRGVGANKTQKSITRIARALGTVAPILDRFDDDNGVTKPGSVHRVANSDTYGSREVHFFCDVFLSRKLSPTVAPTV